MKLRTTVYSLAGAVLLGGAFLSGCTTTNDTTTNPNVTYTLISRTIQALSPNQLYAFTVTGAKSPVIVGVEAWDDKSIIVFWNHDASDSNPDTVSHLAVSSVSSASNTITWATAYKSGPINIYETNDPSAGHPSGLIIGNTSSGAPLDAANKPNLDLILKTDSTVPGSLLSVQSPDVVFAGGRSTFFKKGSYMVHGGAMNNYFAGDITSQISLTDTTNFYDVPSSTVGDSSSILLLYTFTKHFARVEIVPDASTQKLWTETGGTSNHKYITVNVWSQPSINWGYVSRPEGRPRTTLAPKGSQGYIIRQ